jgi:hypothetical protein
MMFLVADIGPSSVAVTLHLIDSNGVPPDKSDATRRKAPRRRFLPTCIELTDGNGDQSVSKKVEAKQNRSR